LFSDLEVFSAWRSQNQFLFTGCVKCCTFLFIDVIVGWVCVTFCIVFSFLFSDVGVYEEGLLLYVLEFFIGVGNRDIMTKELSLICLFL
jgi:hypothetical protein